MKIWYREPAYGPHALAGAKIAQAKRGDLYDMGDHVFWDTARQLWCDESQSHYSRVSAEIRELVAVDWALWPEAQAPPIPGVFYAITGSTDGRPLPGRFSIAAGMVLDLVTGEFRPGGPVIPC